MNLGTAYWNLNILTSANTGERIKVKAFQILHPIAKLGWYIFLSWEWRTRQVSVLFFYILLFSFHSHVATPFISRKTQTQKCHHCRFFGDYSYFLLHRSQALIVGTIESLALLTIVQVPFIGTAIKHKEHWNIQCSLLLLKPTLIAIKITKFIYCFTNFELETTLSIVVVIT